MRLDANFSPCPDDSFTSPRVFPNPAYEFAVDCPGHLLQRLPLGRYVNTPWYQFSLAMLAGREVPRSGIIIVAQLLRFPHWFMYSFTRKECLFAISSSFQPLPWRLAVQPAVSAFEQIRRGCHAESNYSNAKRKKSQEGA